jgi:hypothetical protein
MTIIALASLKINLAYPGHDQQRPRAVLDGRLLLLVDAVRDNAGHGGIVPRTTKLLPLVVMMFCRSEALELRQLVKTPSEPWDY